MGAEGRPHGFVIGCSAVNPFILLFYRERYAVASDEKATVVFPVSPVSQARTIAARKEPDSQRHSSGQPSSRASALPRHLAHQREVVVF